MIRIEAIKPKRPFLVGIKQFERLLNIAQDEAADEAIALFEKTTASWNTRVNFYKRKLRSGVWSVGTASKVYKFVDKGTRAHAIAPHGKALRFSSNYRAKTRAGVIGSNGGGASGAAVFTRRAVQHPGTEARGFSVNIAERMRKVHARKVREAVMAMVRG